MSFNIETDINWSLFSPEEKGKIVAAYQNGLYNLLGAIPNNITPQIEEELQKIALEIMPMPEDSESQVRHDLALAMLRGENPIQTPEDEAKWQKKIDDEKAEVKERRKSLKKKSPVDEKVAGKEEPKRGPGRPKKESTLEPK